MHGVQKNGEKMEGNGKRKIEKYFKEKEKKEKKCYEDMREVFVSLMNVCCIRFYKTYG